MSHSHNHQHSHSHSHEHDCGGEMTNQNDANAQYQQQRHKMQVKSSFANYSKDMRLSYQSIYSNKKIGQYFELVRERKREQMQIALAANQKFLDQILSSVGQDEQTEVFDQVTQCHNISKIRTTIKQFYREWCAESPQVKDYQYLVKIAKKYLKPKSLVLVPGCGLGRLALDLIEAGFGVQGNQVTYFMLFGSNFILNCSQQKQQFQIYPFIHVLGNHQKQQDMFRSVKVPDKLAIQVVSQDCDFSMASGEFTEIYNKYTEKFDSVITCFFIDTANNIFDYIDTIYSTLKNQGIWINYGPLLYHFKDMLDQISVELSWEQIQAYAELKGFKLLEQEKRESTYCHDPLASYEHIYSVKMTVWKKMTKQ